MVKARSSQYCCLDQINVAFRLKLGALRCAMKGPTEPLAISSVASNTESFDLY